MKIIFLDIDGVLLPYGQPPQGPANMLAVAAFNDIIRFSQAKIVISSSWRIDRTVEGLRDLLKHWYVDGEVIDKTPHLYTLDGRDAAAEMRGREIDAWLRYTPYDIVSFVILDDCPDVAPHNGRLVRTQLRQGLTTKDAEQALKFLDIPVDRAMRAV